MNKTQQISTSIKTSKTDWNRFRAACIETGSQSSEVLGYFIKLVNDKQMSIPVLDKQNNV